MKAAVFYAATMRRGPYAYRSNVGVGSGEEKRLKRTLIMIEGPVSFHEPELKL